MPCSTMFLSILSISLFQKRCHLMFRYLCLFSVPFPSLGGLWNQTALWQQILLSSPFLALLQAPDNRLFHLKPALLLSIQLRSSEQVKAVDRKLGWLSRHCTTSPQDYIHPNATAADLSSHNATDPGATMKTAPQVERALHLSLDIVSPCKGNLGLNLLVLVLVFNRATDFALRQAIRETYGSVLSKSATSEIYFFIAKPEDSLVQASILTESALYGDLIQVDYTDSYYNCTIKAVAMLRWTALHCPLVKFMLKLDDDSFLRPRPLLRWLQGLPPNHIYGWEVQNERPVTRGGKWALSARYYPATRYPDYLNGAYLIPGLYTSLLYQAVLSNLPAVPFEDAYITGILPQTIGLSRGVGTRMTCKFTDAFEHPSTLANTYLIFNLINSTGIRLYWNAWKGEN